MEKKDAFRQAFLDNGIRPVERSTRLEGLSKTCPLGTLSGFSKAGKAQGKEWDFYECFTLSFRRFIHRNSSASTASSFDSRSCFS
jgi:hypothetical protein